MASSSLLNLPPVEKNFYMEHPAITALSADEVRAWRREHQIEVSGGVVGRDRPSEVGHVCRAQVAEAVSSSPPRSTTAPHAEPSPVAVITTCRQVGGISAGGAQSGRGARRRRLTTDGTRKAEGHRGCSRQEQHVKQAAIPKGRDARTDPLGLPPRQGSVRSART